MGARKELNKFHVLGGLAVAAIVGILANSWAVFAAVAAILLGAAVRTREIRRGRDGRW